MKLINKPKYKNNYLNMRPLALRSLLILLLFLTFYNSFPQSYSESLIDSLSIETNSIYKSKLSNKIAMELKDTDWKRAIKYLEFSKEQSISSNSEEAIAEFYTTAADIYYAKDVLDVALDYYQKAYLIYNQKKYNQKKYKIENDLAIIYARLKNYDKALLYFKSVYHYQSQQKDSLYLAQILNNIGTLYKNKNLDSSVFYYHKSLKIADDLKSIKLYAYLYTNLGRIYYLRNETERSKFYFQKSLSLVKKDLPAEVKKMVFQMSSEYFLKSNQIDSAIHYALKSKELLNNDIYNFNSQDANHTLYRAHLLQKNYKKASIYFELYNTIRDSINIEEKAVNVERLKLKLEYKNREQIRALKEKEKRFLYLIFGLILLLLLLVLVIILINYKNRLNKVQSEKELVEVKRKELHTKLELKSRSLISKAMTEIHRTEIIENVITDLKKVKLKAIKKETEISIELIIKRLSKDINSNIWNEFEVSFNKVHEIFNKNLYERHPQLTSTDKRLCSLLLLNLSSKEISLLLGQSAKSVENARTRLRKKLNLTNTKNDLNIYLTSLNQ